MKTSLKNQLETVLKHIYINPLEKCNLRCAICYTRKTSPIMSEVRIESFIRSYRQSYTLESITFCGGEVFTLPYFPQLVNTMTSRNIFVQIITNGTIDRLNEFTHPNGVNVIVSLDGLPPYHDRNRGTGNFAKSITFLKHAARYGFHSEVFSIVTGENYSDLDAFEQYVRAALHSPIQVTYHPRKPPAYLMHHPISNIYGQMNGFSFLNLVQMMELLRNHKTFPPKDLGCYQLALMSDGRVFGCCEGPVPIGTIDDPILSLTSRLKEKIEQWDARKFHKGCLGCSYPDFLCGMHEYFRLLAHKTVV